MSPASTALQKENEALRAENAYLRVKAATSLLRTDDSKLWDIAANFPVGIVYLEEGTCTINNLVAEMTGYAASDFQNEDDWFNLLYPGRVEEVKGYWLEDRAQGFPKPRTVELIRKDKSLLYVEFQGKLFPKGEVWVLMDVTEKIRAQQALADREMRQSAMLKALPDMIFLLNREGVYLECHAPYPEQLLRPVSELIGQNYHHILPPDVAMRCQQATERAFETGLPQIIEYRLDTPSGKTYWEAHIVAYDTDRVLVAVRDTTQRTLAEIALQESEKLYKTLFEVSPEGILLGKAGEILYVNPAFAQILGYDSPEEIVGHDFYEFLHPDYHKRVRQVVSELDAGAEPSLYVERYRRKDGSVVDCEVVGTRFDYKGVRASLAVFRDITEKLAVERRLEQREALFRAFMDNSPFLAAVKDSEGRYIYSNRRVSDYYNIAEAFLLGKKDTDFTNPEDAEQQFADELRAMQSQLVVERETILTGADNQPRSWNVLKFPIVVREGDAPLLGVIAIETTERKRLEQELAQANKMESIGRLAGGVAHDFNNLLTVILGYTETLLTQAEPGTSTHNRLKNIKQAGDRATDLTRQLLAFARKQIIAPKVLDLHELLHAFEPLIQRLIGEHILFQVYPLADSALVKADAGQLEQVALNLAINARDAMPQGGALTLVTQSITLNPREAQQTLPLKQGRYVRLSVTDTGAGIAQEHLQHLFEPFFTTKERGSGTGLGLAICHGIVTQLGGHIVVESELGVGTSFHIYMPQAEEAERAEPTAETTPVEIRGEETILLVEDEPLIREMTKQALEAQGYRVLTAENGVQALEVVRQSNTRIDVVLTDIVMPQMNGRQLVENLSRLHPHIRVLYMSGYAEATALSLEELPAPLPFIHKPFKLTTLAQKVREILDQK